MIRIASVIALASLFVLAGCNSKPPPPPDPKTRFRDVTVKVLIPQSDQIRLWIEDQRGEWGAETGGQVELENVSLTDLVAPNGSIPGSALAEQSSVAGDILVFPATQMANVVASGHATRVPKEVYEATEYEHLDIARAVREQLIAWDRQPYSLPVSGECMLVYYRIDLFGSESHRQAFQAKYQRELRPPLSWDEFDQVAEYFDGQDLNGDGSADHSVALSSAGEALLCRAAAYGKAAQNFSFYFDVNTLEPLATGPAFQEALQKWIDIARCIASPGNEDRTMATLSAGQAALGIASSRLAEQWLCSGTAGSEAKARADVGCLPLPASARIYEHDKKRWTELPAEKPNRVAIVNGLVGSVPKTCRHVDAAFDFLRFLTNRERSLPYVTAPPYGLGPYRLSHIIDIAPWAAAGWTANGTSSFVSAMRESLNQGNAVAILRIDASDRYHAALQQAASSALRGEKPGSEALIDVAQAWQAISEERGQDRQRRSYRYSLGMPVLN